MLIARFGGDVLMPDVRHLIAECPTAVALRTNIRGRRKSLLADM
jgi:hypothetical protein